MLSAHYLNYRFSEQHIPAWGPTYASDVNVALEYIPDAETLLSMDLIDVDDISFVDYVVELIMAKDPSMESQAFEFVSYWSDKRLIRIRRAKKKYLSNMQKTIIQTWHSPTMLRHLARISRFAESYVAEELMDPEVPQAKNAIKSFNALGQATLQAIEKLKWNENRLAPLSSATKQHWFAITIREIASQVSEGLHDDIFSTEFGSDVADMIERMFLGM